MKELKNISKILLISLVMVLAILFITAYSQACTEEVKVVYNNQGVEFNNGFPQIYQGRVLLPLRNICEMFGLKVQWDGKTKTVTCSNDTYNIKFQIDNKVAVVNGNNKTMDVTPLNIDGRIYLPARFLVETLSKNIVYVPETHILHIKDHSGQDLK